jgi:hypothetical protein
VLIITVPKIHCKHNEYSNGGAEAKTFKLYLKAITEWLINNPSPKWRKLIKQNRIKYQQIYSY